MCVLSGSKFNSYVTDLWSLRMEASKNYGNVLGYTETHRLRAKLINKGRQTSAWLKIKVAVAKQNSKKK